MYCWVINKFKNGDFKVEYPDNTKDGAPDEFYTNQDRTAADVLFNSTVEELNKAYTQENFSPAPTTEKNEPELEHIPGLGMQEKVYADIVREPGHYKIFPTEEVIDLIRKCLTKEEFIGYCKGNIIKYRLRDKHDNAEDFAKSKEYQKYMQSTETI